MLIYTVAMCTVGSVSGFGVDEGLCIRCYCVEVFVLLLTTHVSLQKEVYRMHQYLQFAALPPRPVKKTGRKKRMASKSWESMLLPSDY